MAKARYLRIAIVPTSRTDLPCAACGGFLTQFAIVTESQDASDAQAGVHRDCIPTLHKKRGS